MRSLPRLSLCAALLGGAPVAPLLAQAPLAALGPDVPYQYYAGLGITLDQLTLTYRAGLPGPPYPGIVARGMGAIGLDEVYVDLIGDSFAGGWLNTFSVQVRGGRERHWAFGIDLRHDRLAAEASATELLGPVVGPAFTAALALAGGDDTGARVATVLTGAGLRISRDVPLGRRRRHALRLDFSLAKYLDARTALSFDGERLASLEPIASQLAADILSREIFDPYGYVGGLGVAYVHRLGP